MEKHPFFVNQTSWQKDVWKMKAFHASKKLQE